MDKLPHSKGMKQRWRRVTGLIVGLVALLVAILTAAPPPEQIPVPETQTSDVASQAVTVLESLAVKGRAPKTGYDRSQFGNGWATVNGCDTRNIILFRDLEQPIVDNDCKVLSGILNDPYTGTVINFDKSNSTAIQIDHVVALGDAWQKGAQQLSKEERIKLANDPLELIAVDGPANQQKSDGDAATWLPSNKGFRCEYVARQIAVKQKYSLWVTEAEKKAMRSVLNDCPMQALPAK